MARNPLWGTEKLCSHAPRVGAGEPGAAATTRRVEGAPATASADGDGPDLLGSTVEVVDELAGFGARDTARDRGRLAPAWRDRPRALRARTGLLFRHWSIPNAKGNGWACREGARRQLASPRVLQWSASGRIAPRPSLLNACGSQPAVLSASRAAPRTACQGGGSHAEPVARSRDGLHKSYRNSRTA